MYVGFYVVRNERIFDSVICRDLEGIADAHVIGGKSHNTAEKSTVRTMTVIGFGKRSIKGKFYFFKRTGEKLSCKQSDSGSSCSMGAGWSDHIRSHDIKNTDKGHSKPPVK